MPIQEIGDVNVSEGMHKILIYVADIEPIFFPLLLFAIFIILAIGSYLLQKNTTGRGDLKASLAASGFVTTLIAYVLSLIPLIDVFTLVICFVLTAFFVLLLLLPKTRS